MRRVAIAAIATATVLWPARAGAREEITPSTIVTGKVTFLTLTAANETNVDLVKVSVTAPAGVAFGPSTRQPAGWAVERSASRVTWTGGVVKADTFDEWGFEIAGTARPGTINYAVTLAYADGVTNDVTVAVVARARSASTDSSATSGADAVTLQRAKSRASTALLLGWVALGVAVVALLLALLRPTSTRTRAQQDW